MLKLGNTNINSLGNGINKAYLGLIEVFGLSFISLWETTSTNETIQLPITNLYSINWGDGTTTTNATSHEYTSIGQYEIKISGIVSDFEFNNSGDKEKIKQVTNAGGLILQGGSFNGCSNLTTLDGKFKKPLASLGNAFLNCNTFNSDLLTLDVSDVSILSSTFDKAYLFNGDISNWETGNVTSLQSCFYQCYAFNGDISNWDVAKVTSMATTFFQATSFNGDVSNWDTEELVNCATLFQGATMFNSELNGWKMGKVTSIKNMLRQTSFNHPLNLWDTSKVTNMGLCFALTTAFNQDVSSWDFSSVTTINSFMSGKTSADYDANYYDNLLIKWDNVIGGLVFANMVNVNIGMGTIKYTATGASARASLISKGFVISDGGLL